MDVKELRQAAEWLKDKAFLDICEIERMGGDSHSIEFRLSDLATHILTTIHDDDDEDVDHVFLSQFGRQDPDSEIWWNLSRYRVCFGRLGAVFHFNGTQFARVKTRGPFRSLCRGLGIPTPESTHEL